MIRFAAIFLLSLVLWIIQVIPQDISIAGLRPDTSSKGGLAIALGYFLFSNRFWIGPLAWLCITGLSFYDAIYRPRRGVQAVLYHQLKDIIEEFFKNDQNRVRITVFKEVGWWEASFHYWWHSVWGDGPRTAKSLRNTLIAMPPPFKGRFLIAFSRVGTPGRTALSSFFLIPDDDALRSHGVVGLAWNDPKDPVRVELPLISDNEARQIRTSHDENSLPADLKKKTRDYMERGNLHSFDQMRRMHRLSASLWARLIHDSALDPWGVLIVDSVKANVVPKNKERALLKHIAGIQAVILRSVRPA